jgi:hypothetical protein
MLHLGEFLFIEFKFKKVKNGKRKEESGKWEVESGKWKINQG